MVDFQSRDARSRFDDADDEGDEEETAPEREGDDADAEAETASVDADRSTDEPVDADGLGAAVVVVDEQPSEDDPAGVAIAETLDGSGYDIVAAEFLRKDHDGVQGAVDALVARDDVSVVVTAGGTGLGQADATIEAVHPLFEKVLPGFGELFRHRYADEIGAAAVATRATAGIADGVPVFCLPGDEEAALLGTAEFVAPQAVDIVDQLD